MTYYIMENKDLANYRYERKFVVNNKELSEIEQGIKFHPAIFKEIFYERQVNNIYFDTIGFKNYHENVGGLSDRYKNQQCEFVMYDLRFG